MSDDDEVTSLDMLSDYECSECEWVVDPDDPLGLTEDEALGVLGGDENGFLRCPNDWCDGELELTVAASIDMLRLVAERMPETADEIGERVTEALATEEPS